jgi:hypothetical protein
MQCALKYIMCLYAMCTSTAIISVHVHWNIFMCLYAMDTPKVFHHLGIQTIIQTVHLGIHYIHANLFNADWRHCIKKKKTKNSYQQPTKKSPRGNSVGWRPRLMKRRSLVRIPPFSCVDMSKPKKKKKKKKPTKK